MAWIESHQELARHPKLKRLCRRLGIRRIEAIGHLHLLWYWALDYAPDGDLGALSAEDIAEEMDYPGDADAFVAALVEAGFLDRDGDRLAIHDNDDYNGKLQYQRERNREKQRRYREAKRDVTVTPPSHNRTTNQPTNLNQPTVNPHPPPPLPHGNGEALPVGDEADRLFAVFCEVTKTPPASVPAATKRKQHGVFAALLGAYDGGDVEGCMRWLASWRAVPWTPDTVGKEIDTWILEQRPAHGKRAPTAKPKRPPPSNLDPAHYRDGAHLKVRGRP